jgi:hypothetical protein
VVLTPPFLRGRVRGYRASRIASVPDLIFPKAPLPPGPFPERLVGDPSPSLTAFEALDLRRSDYEGWSKLDGINPRISWVADPAGSGLTVMRTEVYGDDKADQLGGCRATVGNDHVADQSEGKSGYASLGIYLPSDFQRPDQWMLLWQNFSTGGNPPQAIELRPGPSGGSVKNWFWWKNQRKPTSKRTYSPLGPALTERWHYFLWLIDPFTVTSQATVKVWYKLDSMPDPGADAAEVSVSGINTLYKRGRSGSKVWLGTYRGRSDHSQHQVVYYRGYRRSADLDVVRAMP